VITDSRLYFGEVDLEAAGPNGTPFLYCPYVLDLEVARDVFAGPRLPYVMFHVTEQGAPGGATAPAAMPTLVYADSADLATNPTLATCIGGTGVILTATHIMPTGIGAAGFTLHRRFYLPFGTFSQSIAGLADPLHLQRYIGVGFLQPRWSGNYFSAGKLEAGVVFDPPFAEMHSRLIADASN
jgi:hypothetical protein